MNAEKTLKAIKPPPKKVVINISTEVFEYIAKHSRPLMDTPDSTLRRLFGLPEKQKKDKA